MATSIKRDPFEDAYREWVDCENCNGRGDFYPFFDEETRRVVLNLCSSCSGQGIVQRWYLANGQPMFPRN